MCGNLWVCNDINMEQLICNLMQKKKKTEDFILQEYNLTHFHSMYLGALLHKDNITLAELTSIVGFDKANTTRAVKDLLNKGYVEKVGQSVKKFTIILSEKGRQIGCKLKQKIDELIEKVFSVLSKDEKLQFCDLMKKLLEGDKNA